MSQNFDIGLSYCFILCSRSNFLKNYKKSQMLRVVCSKIKTRTKINNLRNPSINKNVLYTY